MTKGHTEKKTEIWLKYCEDCIKSKIEGNDECSDNSLKKSSKKTDI
jgi:hypothetical protein